MCKVKQINKHEGMIKGFTQLSRSWYTEANKKEGRIDSVMFGFYEGFDGGTTGELEMEWIELGSIRKPVAKLNVFEDGFSALAEFKDVIDELALVDSELIQPKEFCDILLKCGFMDFTKETR